MVSWHDQYITPLSLTFRQKYYYLWKGMKELEIFVRVVCQFSVVNGSVFEVVMPNWHLHDAEMHLICLSYCIAPNCQNAHIRRAILRLCKLYTLHVTRMLKRKVTGTRTLYGPHGFFQCFIITRSTHQHRKQRLFGCWPICSKPLQPVHSSKHHPISISRPRNNAPQCYSIGVGRKDKQPICILLSNAKHHSERLWTEGEATRFRIRHQRMLIKRATDWFSLAWIFWQFTIKWAAREDTRFGRAVSVNEDVEKPDAHRFFINEDSGE